MFEKIACISILFTLIGFAVYCMSPHEWQTKTGFAIIVLGWIPVGVIGLTVFAIPELGIPALIVACFMAATPRRA